jgi:hypothetical protein
MSKHAQRVKELEDQAEQQQKIIKRKTEQVANAQRRLRTVNRQGSDDKQGYVINIMKNNIMTVNRQGSDDKQGYVINIM